MGYNFHTVVPLLAYEWCSRIRFPTIFTIEVIHKLSTEFTIRQCAQGSALKVTKYGTLAWTNCSKKRGNPQK